MFVWSFFCLFLLSQMLVSTMYINIIETIFFSYPSHFLQTRCENLGRKMPYLLWAKTLKNYVIFEINTLQFI